MSEPVNLSVLVMKQGKDWTAYCLEYPIIALARNYGSLKRVFRDMVAAHIHSAVSHGKKPFAEEAPAPDEFQTLYDNYEEGRWMQFTISNVRTICRLAGSPDRKAA